ncbi:MAG: 3-deoxy-D-manno-octulosonic acid transferase [Armatimonadota bacterium]|nr:3-deoxy-D-manno-octulosonic acid transferase [Armatimonadota bacterium]
MYFLYSLLFGAWVTLMTPYFLYRAWRHQKYLPALRQRLGFLPDTLQADGRPTIWIHSCSVGETLSVQPLAHALHERFPGTRFVFSTITKTGQAIAQERFSKYGAGNAFYFPIDLASIANKVLDWIQPSLLITIDTEIWPNVLHQAHRRNIPIVMANGRISAESFQYYRWIQPLIGPVFQNYSALLMKSKEDAERLQRMGAPPSKILVSGNIKYDRNLVEKDVSEAQARALDHSLSLTATDAPLIVAGSTHPDEEQILLDVLKRLRQMPGLEATRLLLVPRHPERFGTVAALAAKSGFTIKRRSDSSPVPPLSGARGSADVLILDTLGELAAAYQFATVVFVGGTLIPHGGQSIMEPAVYGKAIVVGPSMKNFPQIIDDFIERGGIIQIPAEGADKEAQKQQLTEAFARLLQDPDARAKMGQAAYSVFEGSQGATQFTVDKIAAIYEEVLAR